MAADGKNVANKPLEMIKAGGSSTDASSEETGSSRMYPKGGMPSMTPAFNPMTDKRRGGTDWAVGGI